MVRRHRHDADLFAELGRDFARGCPVTVVPVGAAEARLFSQRATVDFAVGRLRTRGR